MHVAGIIGERVRRRRVRLGYTQFRLAGEAGVSREAIARLEASGQHVPRIETLVALSKALECSVEELLGQVAA